MREQRGQNYPPHDFLLPHTVITLAEIILSLRSIINNYKILQSFQSRTL